MPVHGPTKFRHLGQDSTGSDTHGELDRLDDALFDEIFATNVRGSFAVVRALRRLLDQSDHALVVNLSSIAAVTAMGSNVAFCASKAAVDNMTRSLTRALAPRIRVVSVSPGLADTEVVKAMDAGWRDEQAHVRQRVDWRSPRKSLVRCLPAPPTWDSPPAP